MGFLVFKILQAHGYFFATFLNPPPPPSFPEIFHINAFQF